MKPAVLRPRTPENPLEIEDRRDGGLGRDHRGCERTRKGTTYEREDVIQAMARFLGFVRVTDTIRQPIKSALNRATRHGLLGHERGTTRDRSKDRSRRGVD